LGNEIENGLDADHGVCVSTSRGSQKVWEPSQRLLLEVLPLLPEELHRRLPLLSLLPQPSLLPLVCKICSRYAISNLRYTSFELIARHLQLAQQQQQAGAAGGGGLGAGAGANINIGGMNLQQLAASPQAAQLRELVRTNPQMLQPVVQQLAASDPALAQAIAQNPELLYQILAGGDGEGMEGIEGEGGELPPGAHVVELSAAEREAVQRVSPILICSSMFCVL
jgi:hypothetical protein